MERSIKLISEKQLLQKANQLAGETIGCIASELQLSVPKDLKTNKGWVGQLIENYLGVTTNGLAQPDFAHLGIELKTLPIDENGKPLESTFVCLAPLSGLENISWDSSHLNEKLSKVLWVPIISNKSIALKDKRICPPFLWAPDQSERQLLKRDWEELMEQIVFGRFDEINGRNGEVLQLRPKGANRLSSTSAYNLDGKSIKTLPLGFYLRSNFTHSLLKKYYS